MIAAYNEIEPYACSWLRALSAANAIALGDVIERSIVDLVPGDVRSLSQFHAFAGIGVWSYALRLAGWPDHERVWTGSCPCQPFSSAGRKKRFDDARHLWPEWFRLIRECRPPVVFGEQVASPDGLHWLDAVSSDLEGAGYSFAAFDLCAAGVGAPHRRQRLYFVAVADARSARSQGRGLRGHGADQRIAGASGVADVVANAGVHERGSRRDGLADGGPQQSAGCGDVGRLADADSSGCGELGVDARADSDPPPRHDVDGCGAARVVGDANSARAGRDSAAAAAAQATRPGERPLPRRLGHESVAAGATCGAWGGADWLYCQDGKYRPVEPGTFPLAHGAPSRVGRLRAYGNAIVPQLAATFIRSVMAELGIGGAA